MGQKGAGNWFREKLTRTECEVRNKEQRSFYGETRNRVAQHEDTIVL